MTFEEFSKVDDDDDGVGVEGRKNKLVGFR
jgi:hypothetical protein